MPRALMVTGDAAEDLDAMYPLYRLREDGNMVSCRGWPDMPEWSRAFMAVLDRVAVPA